MVKHGVRRRIDRAALHRLADGGSRVPQGPLSWIPMNEVLHSKRSKLPPREKRALRGLCSGAHWCQYRVS
eukprot:2739532-Pyramimonas_sp.AAC.1